MIDHSLLHSRASAQSLAFLRIWVFGAWWCKVLVTPFTELAALPVDLFQPVGLLNNLPAAWLLAGPALWALKLVLLATLGWAVIGGRQARAAMGLGVLLLLIEQALLRGFSGHINHGELPLWFAALVVAVSPSLDAFAWRTEQGTGNPRESHARYRLPLQLIALLFCLTYMFVGAVRCFDGGLPLMLSDNLKYWAVQGAYFPRYYTNQFGLMVYDYPQLVPLLKAGFVMVTLFELASPFALVSRKFRWLWLMVMVSFHCGTLLLMNIFFTGNLVLMLVMFDYTRWLKEVDLFRKPAAPPVTLSRPF